MCRRAGGNSEVGTPVPIPNTEVKLFSSDDTLGAAPRENRTSPFHPPTWAVSFISICSGLISAKGASQGVWCGWRAGDSGRQPHQELCEPQSGEESGKGDLKSTALPNKE